MVISSDEVPAQFRFEILQGVLDPQRQSSAQRAERSDFQSFQQVVQKLARDLVPLMLRLAQHLPAAHRAEAAREAFPAGLRRGELEQVFEIGNEGEILRQRYHSGMAEE